MALLIRRPLEYGPDMPLSPRDVNFFRPDSIRRAAFHDPEPE